MARRLLYRAMLRNPAYRFLFEPGPPGEVVSLDCETTGLNPWLDDVIAVAAVQVRGNRILTSERFEAIVRVERPPSAESIKVHGLREHDLDAGRPMDEVLPELLRFIGGRPILGYYIDFDFRMLNKYVWRQLGTRLPNERIEISGLYFDRKYGNAPQLTSYDLRFATIVEDLGIPMLRQHDAYNDALMSAMIYLQLHDLQQRGSRIQRANQPPNVPPPTGG